MCAAKASEIDEILDVITVEKLLDSVSVLSICISLFYLANEFIQARKGPLIDGKYVNPKSNTSQPKPESPKRGEVSMQQKDGSSEDRNNKSAVKTKNVKCFNCQEFRHYAISCPEPDKRKRGAKANANALLCLTPLVGDFLPQEFTVGEVNSKPAQMLIDSGCTRTLVHRKFAPTALETGNFISVLLANGESISVPLAKVRIDKHNKSYVETVGVVDNLPVDCLLGRPSYGKSLDRQDVINHWESVSSIQIPTDDTAYVVTRSKTLRDAIQARHDALVDRENDMALN